MTKAETGEFLFDDLRELAANHAQQKIEFEKLIPENISLGLFVVSYVCPNRTLLLVGSMRGDIASDLHVVDKVGLHIAFEPWQRSSELSFVSFVLVYCPIFPCTSIVSTKSAHREVRQDYWRTSLVVPTSNNLSNVADAHVLFVMLLLLP